MRPRIRLRWNRTAAALTGAVAGAGVVLAAVLLVPSTEPLPEPGTIRVLSGRDVSEGRQRGQLVEQWNAMHPDGPRAEIVETSGDADQQYAQARAAAQDGGEPGPSERIDVFNLDVTWTAEFAAAGYLLPIDSDTSGFLAEPLRSGAYDGVQYALPFNSDTGLLYYRGDLVAAPPTTWDELAADASRVLADPAVRAADPALEAGIALQLADYEGFSVNVMEWVWGHGGDLGEGGPAAETALRELDARLNGDDALILRDSLRHREADGLTAFAEGRTVFLRHWPYAYRELARAGMVPCGQPGRSYCVARLPGAGALGGQNLAVSAHTDQPVAARKLVEFLTDARSQQLLFERGGFAATRQVVYLDTKVRADYPYAALLLDALVSARRRPESPRYQRYSEVLRGTAHPALSTPDILDASGLRRALDAALE